MELFILIVDGQPFGYPMSDDDLKQEYPNVDINNLPTEFARVVSVDMPPVGIYEIYEGTAYELNNNVCTEVHYVRQMTDEEKLLIQNQTKYACASSPNYHELLSWVFDEELCRYVPPIPFPSDIDTKTYRWNEQTISWDII